MFNRAGGVGVRGSQFGCLCFGILAAKLTTFMCSSWYLPLSSTEVSAVGPLSPGVSLVCMQSINLHVMAFGRVLVSAVQLCEARGPLKKVTLQLGVLQRRV